jgi:D-arabinose 1-dehydrogenase-like Zn-dependent alcohol dehydrogenase
VQLAKAEGAFVYGVDIPEKAEHIRKLGIDEFIMRCVCAFASNAADTGKPNTGSVVLVITPLPSPVAAAASQHIRAGGLTIFPRKFETFSAPN